MTIRHVHILCTVALVALGAAMASVIGCAPPPVQLPPQGVLSILAHDPVVVPGEELELEATIQGVTWETSGNPREDRSLPEANTYVITNHPAWGTCAQYRWYYWPVGTPVPGPAWAVDNGWGWYDTYGMVFYYDGMAYPYHVSPETDASVTPKGLQATSNTASFIGITPGMYFVLCHTMDGTQVAQTVITVGPTTPIVPPPASIIIAIPGITVTIPVVVGFVYTLPAMTGIDWATVVPAGGICVFWNRPGDGTVLVGTITLVNGVPQLVFNETGIAVIASTIVIGTVGQVDVYFNINISQTQTTQIGFTIWVTGTGPVTPPNDGGIDVVIEGRGK